MRPTCELRWVKTTAHGRADLDTSLHAYKYVLQQKFYQQPLYGPGDDGKLVEIVAKSEEWRDVPIVEEAE